MEGPIPYPSGFVVYKAWKRRSILTCSNPNPGVLYCDLHVSADLVSMHADRLLPPPTRDVVRLHSDAHLPAAGLRVLQMPPLLSVPGTLGLRVAQIAS